MGEENVVKYIVIIRNKLCSLQEELEQLKLTLKDKNSIGNQLETKNEK